MNLTITSKLLFVLAATALVASGAEAQTSVGSLAPIAFLTTHEWDAQLPDSPDGKKIKIHAQFTWAQNKQAIRISNQFVTDGKGSPYIDGLYAWDPRRQVIAFWYVDAKGGLSEGTVKVEDGKLVHEFQEIQPDGKTAEYVARVTPHGDQAWENEIFAKKDGGLTPLVKVRYQVAQ
ncbi:MAG: hypothetical protein JWO45_1918 [Spartobacteria bacterium]|nr:hypothetical protein [Spartobacteria bacterium]